MFELSMFQSDETVSAKYGDTEIVRRVRQLQELLEDYPKDILYGEITYEDILCLIQDFGEIMEYLVLRGKQAESLAEISARRYIPKRRYLL